jgi:hypothetical protein
MTLADFSSLNSALGNFRFIAINSFREFQLERSEGESWPNTFVDHRRRIVKKKRIFTADFFLKDSIDQILFKI